MNLCYHLPPFVLFVISLALCFVVLWQNRRSSLHRVFAAFLGAIAAWGIIIFSMRVSPDVEHALIWEKLVGIPSVLLGLFFYIFVYNYTGKTPNKHVIVLTYLYALAHAALIPTSLIVSGMQIKPYGYAPVPGPLFPVFVIIGFGLVIMALVRLVSAYRLSRDYNEKNRIAYMIIGMICSLLGAVFDMLPLLGLPLYPGSIIGSIIFCCLTTVAILRYRLLDIRFVLRRGTAYFLTTILFAIPFVAVFFLIMAFFTKAYSQVWPYLLIMAMVFSILLPYLWRKIQQRVDRWFYRDRYNYLTALETFSRSTHSLSDPTGLASKLVELLAGALHTSSVYLLQTFTLKGDFVTTCYASANTPTSALSFKSEGALVGWLERTNRLLYYRDVDIIAQLQSITAKERENLDRIGAELIVPLKNHTGRLFALLIFGPKLSGESYTTEDEQLIQTMSIEMGIKLDNASLYDDVIQARLALETWLNSMSDYVLIIGTDGMVQFMNKIAEERFGTAGERTCWMVLGREAMCPQCPVQLYNDGIRKGCNYTIDTMHRQYDVAVAPLLNPDGSLSIIEVLRDVTDKKLLEEERVKMEKLESISTLAGGIAHDFNNLLTGIMGNISLAKKHVDPGGKALKRLDEAIKASERTRDLTQQLLTFAKGGAPIKKTISISRLITDSVSFALRGSNTKAVLSISEGLQDIEADEGQINQVITNLTINAAEAMPSGGILNIEAKNTTYERVRTLHLPKGGYVEITFEDHGIGIAKEHLDKIFDPYFTTKEKGSGLGLATTYSIIKNHDGYITVESEPNIGTTFRLYLPATQKAMTKEKVEEIQPSFLGKGRILVMDDEELIREFLSQELTDAGYAVELTKDGAEAVDQYKKAKESGEPFDAVIMDLTIPGGMGGKEAIKQLLEIDPGIKAIVSSGYSIDSVMADYKKYGFSGVIAKPYIVAQIEKVLRDLLG